MTSRKVNQAARRPIIHVVIVLFLAAGCATPVGPPPVYKLSTLELQHRIHADARRLERYRHRLESTLAYVGQRRDLRTAGETSLLTAEQKEVARQVWAGTLDLFLALDSLKHYHAGYWRVRDDDLRRDSFVLFYGAFATQYAAALRLMAFARGNPDLDKVLDEPMPAAGQEKGTWSRFRFRFLNVGIATQLATLDRIYEHYGHPDLLGLKPGTDEAVAYLWTMGRGPGIEMTFENAAKMVQQAGFAVFFPVQAGVSEWMGDTRVKRPHSALISASQIEEVAPLLAPGDILLERREWYLSNIGLPGYWPHAALYVGTPEERRAYFGNDAGVAEWVRAQGEPSGDLEALLAARTPEAYAAHRCPDAAGHAPRVLEAISEGVCHTTLEHSAACDSLAVLRPRRDKREKARAIYNAFGFAGRPYDFDFDFVTDSALVCTELVAKAWAPAAGFAGLAFPVVRMAGHKVTPANLIARQAAKEADAPDRALDLVLFLDGYEKEGEAFHRDAAAFQRSWRRPKWHILTQDAPPEDE